MLSNNRFQKNHGFDDTITAWRLQNVETDCPRTLHYGLTTIYDGRFSQVLLTHPVSLLSLVICEPQPIPAYTYSTYLQHTGTFGRRSGI